MISISGLGIDIGNISDEFKYIYIFIFLTNIIDAIISTKIFQTKIFDKIFQKKIF